MRRGGAACAAAAVLAAPAAAEDPWRVLEDGLDVARFSADPSQVASPGSITVLRVDPERFSFRLLSTTTGDPAGNRTVKDWLLAEDLVACANAGMFATDYVTHIGYMGCGGERNNARVNAYLSAAAFRPLRPDLPAFRIFDLDATEFREVRQRYACIVQNLRLIKRSRENRWPQQGKRWSELCLAEDAQGRALLIHSREPTSMHDLNEILLSLPLGVVCAQHLEGGPEAQLVYRDGDVGVELVGSFEPGFLESEGAALRSRVPNVIGVARREE